jgi:hypothetical protein
MEPDGHVHKSVPPCVCPDPNESSPFCSILLLSYWFSYYLWPCLPNGLFLSGLPTKILHIFFSCSIHDTCPLSKPAHSNQFSIYSTIIPNRNCLYIMDAMTYGNGVFFMYQCCPKMIHTRPKNDRMIMSSNLLRQQTANIMFRFKVQSWY